MSDRWVVMTELEFWGGDPAYDKTVPTWVVSDNGEDDPPLCYCDGEPESRTIANALNAVQAARHLRDETELRNHNSALWQRLDAALGEEHHGRQVD